MFLQHHLKWRLMFLYLLGNDMNSQFLWEVTASTPACTLSYGLERWHHLGDLAIIIFKSYNTTFSCYFPLRLESYIVCLCLKPQKQQTTTKKSKVFLPLWQPFLQVAFRILVNSWYVGIIFSFFSKIIYSKSFVLCRESS